MKAVRRQGELAQFRQSIDSEVVSATADVTEQRAFQGSAWGQWARKRCDERPGTRDKAGKSSERPAAHPIMVLDARSLSRRRCAGMMQTICARQIESAATGHALHTPSRRWRLTAATNVKTSSSRLVATTVTQTVTAALSKPGARLP